MYFRQSTGTKVRNIVIQRLSKISDIKEVFTRDWVEYILSLQGIENHEK